MHSCFLFNMLFYVWLSQMERVQLIRWFFQPQESKGQPWNIAQYCIWEWLKEILRKPGMLMFYPSKELEVISYLQAGHQADKTQTRKRWRRMFHHCQFKKCWHFNVNESNREIGLSSGIVCFAGIFLFTLDRDDIFKTCSVWLNHGFWVWLCWP